MLNPNENGTFETLFCYFDEHENDLYTLVFAAGNKIIARFDTSYESDNELELDDPDYEEFDSIVMRNEETGKLFEFNYHNMPIEVYSEGRRII